MGRKLYEKEDIFPFTLSFIFFEDSFERLMLENYVSYVECKTLLVWFRVHDEGLLMAAWSYIEWDCFNFSEHTSSVSCVETRENPEEEEGKVKKEERRLLD